ncbi:MAG TPA: addiction module protein [Pirellulales bacterium]|nr:addiction module protein [Pirellulales bacterium]
MSLREEIAQQALELPAEDRAYVADVIEQSLASGGFSSDEIAAAWASEIERRIEAYDRGEFEAVGAEVALDRLRKQLAEHRARKATP